jgi:aerobic carbon-monoxide dehydrogenase large subunit
MAFPPPARAARGGEGSTRGAAATERQMPPLIGARIARLEDEPLLRGKGHFVDDIALPDALHAAFVRSPHPHAAIASIDKAAALALPGVHAVLTLDDLAAVMVQRRMVRHSNSGMPLEKAWAFALADGETSYVGEPVALVLACDRYVAEDAAALVAVDYEPLPFAADVRKAKDGPPVRRELKSNVITAYKVGFGDADAAFKAAAHVFKLAALAASRRCAFDRGARHDRRGARRRRRHHRAFLDAEGARPVADADLADGLRPEPARRQPPTSAAASAPSSASIPRTWRWSRRRSSLGRSVKWAEDRREYFTNAVHERDQYWTLEIAVDKDARVLGIRGTVLHDTGAYTLQDPNIPYNSASTMTGPYSIPNLAMEVTIAMTNTAPVSSVRGAGYPQAAFAMERLLDLVAREMKLDRAEVRRRNLIPASKMPYQKPLKTRAGMTIQYDSGDYPACQDEVLKAAGWDAFPERQATARAKAATSAWGWRTASRAPAAGRSSPGWCEFQEPARSRSSPARRRWARASPPPWRRSQRASSASPPTRFRCRGRHRRRAARPGRLRQPPDRHRRLVGDAGGQGRGREGQEGRLACAGGGRGRSGIGRRRGARRRRAATRHEAFGDRAHPAGRAGLRLPPGRRSGPRSQRHAPHGCSLLCQRLPRRRGRGRSGDRRK